MQDSEQEVTEAVSIVNNGGKSYSCIIPHIMDFCFNSIDQGPVVQNLTMMD